VSVVFAQPLRLTSECGQYLAEKIADGLGTSFLLFSAANGERLGQNSWWSNRYTNTRVAFEIGNDRVKSAIFSYVRYPRWFHRRWPECWNTNADQLKELVEGCGGKVLNVFKPGMCCWYTISFRGSDGVRRAVDAELRKRNIGFETRQAKGGWGVECPDSERTKPSDWR